MNDDQIMRMVNRFLMWRLPDPFRPDAGISYERGNFPPTMDVHPIGTNLFDVHQAEGMVRHMLDGIPDENKSTERNEIAQFLTAQAGDMFNHAASLLVENSPASQTVMIQALVVMSMAIKVARGQHMPETVNVAEG